MDPLLFDCCAVRRLYTVGAYQVVGTMPYHLVGCQPWEVGISSYTATSDTRDAFLRAAKRLFAERGFYGTSIASIATELNLTKQALIHHFGTKERLYGEVLAQLADRLSNVVAKVRSTYPDPERQLEELLLNLYSNTLEHPDDTQLLMRELLDNKGRAKQAHSWYLKDFLKAVVSMVRKTPSSRALTEAEALARVYLILGAISFFAVSQPTLRQMYDRRAFSALKDQFPLEVRRVVRESFAGS
jgi:AcrR family transcriptional regulator